MKVFLPLSVIFVILATILVLIQAPPVTTNFQSDHSSENSVTATDTPIVSLQAPVSTSTSQAPSPSVEKPVSKPRNKPTANNPTASSTKPTITPQSPYSKLPQSLTSFDPLVRSALVNILCMPNSGTLRPISGSGVIIDPRGLILTNAHVAQYVLVSESPQIDLECTIRTGSPASPHWKAKVLYIPPVWIAGHYADINGDHVIGTGEHDYALLLITQDASGNALSSALPYVPVDTRDITNAGDIVLGGGYPAEFVGGIVAQQGLYAVTSASTIKQLLTFNTSTVDVFSVGGVIEAQGGSSGGPIVNAWGYVIGIISTTSEGATTAERDLHALSLNYIDRDILTQTGHSFSSIVNGNLQQQLSDFSRETAPGLIQKYIEYLSR